MSDLLLWTITLMTLGSGLINLYSVTGPAQRVRVVLLREFFPMEFSHLSAFFTLLAGFALVVSSVNIFRRKKRAHSIVLAAASFSVVFHLTKGLDYEEATFSLLLVVALILTRKYFTVESRSISTLRMVAAQLSLALGIAIAYGFVGFWLLDRRQFGIDFNWLQSLNQTLRCLAFRADTAVPPHTRYAQWFIDSLYLISTTSLTYATFSIFQPVIYHLTTEPYERTRAARIVDRYGTHCQDYFKFWPDKSFYFSASGESFLSYRVASGLAVVLGDPVGPRHEAASIIRQFNEFCRHNGWSAVFYQTPPDLLGVYQNLGFKKLKIGDNAVVNLQTFTLEGRVNKTLRSRINQLEKSGVHVVRYDPPTPPHVLEEAREVSNEWLNIPGRRERAFTLGAFDREYVGNTTLYAAFDKDQLMLGFVNIVPSCRNDETTIDLMRRRADSPNGVMDYLFAKVLLDRRAEGFTYFDLGMAPMAGFREHERAAPEERAVHYFFQHLNFVFSFAGLYAYKAKFANCWEPRYVMYRNVRDLPRVLLALGRVSSINSEVA